jgi:hypothetical protein
VGSAQIDSEGTLNKLAHRLSIALGERQRMVLRLMARSAHSTPAAIQAYGHERRR